MCHCELSLVPAPGVGGGGESYLANTLPPRDLLGTLVLVMLDHITDNRHGLATVQASLRTFLMLTEHDYGFFHLKKSVGLDSTSNHQFSELVTSKQFGQKSKFC